MCLLVTPLNKLHKGTASTAFAHEKQWSLIACICRKLSEEAHAWASSTVFYRFNHRWGSRGKDTTHFLVPEQVTPVGELASHASLSQRKIFKFCKVERAERRGFLHGKSILRKYALIVILTLFYCCPEYYLGDLHLYYYSFSSILCLKELTFFQ